MRPSAISILEIWRPMGSSCPAIARMPAAGSVDKCWHISFPAGTLPTQQQSPAVPKALRGRVLARNASDDNYAHWQNTDKSSNIHTISQRARTGGERLQLCGLELETLHEGVVDIAGGVGDVLLVGCQDLVLRRQQRLRHALQDGHPLLRAC